MGKRSTEESAGDGYSLLGYGSRLIFQLYLNWAARAGQVQADGLRQRLAQLIHVLTRGEDSRQFLNLCPQALSGPFIMYAN
jgi:hypothetical protein